ncbi:Protein HIRA [Frankliniella fusca]|uniref:Protein HIRA n=1 Tax=Frankliniella fusca TaxID=407009 RepID=A0AAE1L890_9NEOP|nr:Protein HIRA [Frankliniella fusca]
MRNITKACGGTINAYASALRPDEHYARYGVYSVGQAAAFIDGWDNNGWDNKTKRDAVMDFVDVIINVSIVR